ncbi:MAG: hypothetical protein BWY91_00797 [bacterium ADurb.BinA028]|nr:MAG: hypothetical protein BWY91_00797 [bacterium ADurb.BinA028]
MDTSEATVTDASASLSVGLSTVLVVVTGTTNGLVSGAVSLTAGDT